MLIYFGPSEAVTIFRIDQMLMKNNCKTHWLDGRSPLQ
jgi:hypothetical protein